MERWRGGEFEWGDIGDFFEGGGIRRGEGSGWDRGEGGRVISGVIDRKCYYQSHPPPHLFPPAAPGSPSHWMSFVEAFWDFGQKLVT